MMRRALSLARRGVGKTSPNPAVGCVIVKDGAIVGEGWHRRAGTPHAEVHALRQAGEAARGADLYVTLEPCSHHGKTPPCADAVVAAGVGRVFAGMVDPNPLVSGQGLARLKDAGIAVEAGLLEAECRRINEPFIKQVTTGLPFVVFKCAMTLDGRIAAASGDSRWITSEASRREVHRLRSKMDAVMVGVETAIADDPLLTVRHVRGENPVRVVVDSRLRLPLTAALLHDGAAETVIATRESGPARHEAFTALGAKILVCEERDGRVDLTDLMRKLAGLGVQSVLLEGGGTLAGEALRRGLIDKFLFFYAPKILGGEGISPFSGPGASLMAEAAKVEIASLKRLGEDIMVEAYPESVCLPG